MKKMLLTALAGVFALTAGGALSAPPAHAQNDRDKAALAECKKLADPKAKDECVKKTGASVKTRTEKQEKATKREKAAKAERSAKGKK